MWPCKQHLTGLYIDRPCGNVTWHVFICPACCRLSCAQSKHRPLDYRPWYHRPTAGAGYTSSRPAEGFTSDHCKYL